jgi:uncharacterized protein YecE (DUF72 family)
MGETRKKKTYRIGCQSWQYDDWITRAGGETVFYPRGTRPADKLSLYSQIFDTIEVDSTAYGTPAISTIDGWIAATPGDFTFSLKVPREITHGYALNQLSYAPFDEFVDAARYFGPRLGVILIQLPAAFESTKENGQNVRAFLARLPDDVRFGIEFRHPGWFVEWTFEELNTRNVALALVAGKWIPEETMFAAFANVATPFGYLRMMGIRDLPSFDRVYRERSKELERWAAKIKGLAANDVFVYVDNYFEGHAPATANKLKQLLGVSISDPAGLEPQISLF